MLWACLSRNCFPVSAKKRSPVRICFPNWPSRLEDGPFSATDPNDLPNVAARIGIELCNQYVLAYSPKNKNQDGKYRKVEVKVTEPASIPNLKVYWRLGYFAPSR
jgi:hypothetical protein